MTIKTPDELMQEIAQRAKAKRLVDNLTQEGLAKRSGVSLGSIKLFENSGKISLESLIKLSIALGAEADFETLFTSKSSDNITIDELLKQEKTRKRGTIK